MFKSILKAWQEDAAQDFGRLDYAPRTYLIDCYKKIYAGTFYDVLVNDFHTEVDETTSYIPISQRIPCVQSNLARVVVDQSVSLVFGQRHFPRVQINEDEKTHKFVMSLIETCKLNKIMQDAMIIGSTGSVVIYLILVDGKPHFIPKSTEALIPIYDPRDPRRLIKIIERAKVPTNILNNQYGYSLPKEHASYWIYKELNETHDITYLPIPADSGEIDESKIKDFRVYTFNGPDGIYSELRQIDDIPNPSYTNQKKIVPTIDRKRTVEHGLGFCPAVWIKNLPTMDNEIDGACTFSPAIESIITLDYTLSQSYRSLKYSSEPVLMIKDPAGLAPKKMPKSANKVLMLGKDADAKWLEINGNAATASVDYAKYLREVVIEAVQGNRVSPEKIHSAQSGKAMELMNQPLIWLAERLRMSYGEFGLVKIIELCVKANQQSPIQLRDGMYPVGFTDSAWTVLLDWPDWYDATGTDLMQEANALAVLRNEGIISLETAIRSQAENYNISNVQDELAQAQSEQKEFISETQPQVKEQFTAA